MSVLFPIPPPPPQKKKERKRTRSQHYNATSRTSWLNNFMQKYMWVQFQGSMSTFQEHSMTWKPLIGTYISHQILQIKEVIRAT